MLLDTNILIYFLNSAHPITGHRWIDNTIKEVAHISVISRIELLGWSGHTEQSEQDARHFIIRNLDEYPLTEAIVHGCISISQQHRIKLPGAIIAATALRLQAPLHPQHR